MVNGEKSFKDCSLNVFLRDWMTCIVTPLTTRQAMALDWVPLMAGKVKINFDGASFGNLGPVGYGCVMQYSQGIVMLVKGGLIGRSDATQAELVGLLEGLCMLKMKSFKDCIIEGDPRTVISWGIGKRAGSWRFHHFTCEVRNVIGDLKATLQHVPRC